MSASNAVTRGDNGVGLAENPALTGEAVELGVARAALALLALELATLRQVGVLVVGVAGAAFPQF